MPYFNLRPDITTVVLHNDPTKLQLFVIILNCVEISNRPQHAQDLNAVLFNMQLITLPSIYQVIYNFHANSNHWLDLSETI